MDISWYLRENKCDFDQMCYFDQQFNKALQPPAPRDGGGWGGEGGESYLFLIIYYILIPYA